jgi:uracil-DNA glycosylase family 4
MLVGEAPGADEALTGKNFVGHAGRILDSLLRQTNIIREDCLVTNVARDQPPGNNIGFFFEDKACTKPKPLMSKYVEMLKEDILKFRPNIVIGLGRTALWALTGQHSISSFRGYVTESTLVQNQKVLCTYHPIKVDIEWKLHFPTIMDLRKAYANSLTPDIPRDQRSLEASVSRREFIEYLKFLYHDHKDPVAFDLETKSPGSHVDIIGLADSPNHAVSLDLFSGREPRFSEEDELEIWYWFAKVLAECETITHNGPYDITVLLYNLGILTRRLFADTLVAGHVCWPEAPRSLGFITSICLNVPPWKHTQATMPTLYNAGDAANTYGIWNVLSAEMKRQKIVHTFEFEMAQIYPASMLQIQGIPISKERQHYTLHTLDQDDNSLPIGLLPRAKQLGEAIDKMLGKKVNLASPKQMQQTLYVDLALPIQYKRRKSALEEKKVTTDAEAMKKLSQLSDNPVLKLIMEWKKLNKLVDFIDITPSPTGSVHTCYNITGATMQRENKGFVVDDEDDYRSFGRWSSSKSIIIPYGSGNLQNVPKRARKIYGTPKAGQVYVSADYMQAEAVVVAYLINDAQLIRMFEESFGKTRAYRKERNIDVHKFTAAQMFRVPIEQVTPELRQVGKTIRHANNYSAGPGVLSAKLGVPLKEAKELMKIYHQACPQLHLWHERIQNDLRATRTLTNLLGRKHKFTDRWGDNLFRSAYSYIPQSTVGDLLNTSLERMYYLFGSSIDLYLQLHDAIYCICNEEDVPSVMQAMKHCMLMPLIANHTTFTIDIDFSIGPNWGQLEEVEYTDYVNESDPDLPQLPLIPPYLQPSYISNAADNQYNRWWYINE